MFCCSDLIFRDPSKQPAPTGSARHPPAPAGDSRLLSPFRLLFHALGALQTIVRPSDLMRTMLATGVCYSTHFSGMGSVEAAADMLNSAVAAFFGFSGSSRSVGACESAQRLRTILQCRVSSCIYSNIMAFVPGLKWSDVRHLDSQARFCKGSTTLHSEGPMVR